MADNTTGAAEDKSCIREAVCIHTRKIFDACRSKDCIEDLRVWPTASSQQYIDSALSVRPQERGAALRGRERGGHNLQ